MPAHLPILTAGASTFAHATLSDCRATRYFTIRPHRDVWRITTSAFPPLCPRTLISPMKWFHTTLLGAATRRAPRDSQSLTFSSVCESIRGREGGLYFFFFFLRLGFFFFFWFVFVDLIPVFSFEFWIFEEDCEFDKANLLGGKKEIEIMMFDEGIVIIDLLLKLTRTRVISLISISLFFSLWK